MHSNRIFLRLDCLEVLLCRCGDSKSCLMTSKPNFDEAIGLRDLCSLSHCLLNEGCQGLLRLFAVGGRLAAKQLSMIARSLQARVADY
jgi:hypothetical protein